MITCPSCGKQNQDYYKFCLGCGTKLPRARMNSDLDETAPQGMPKAAPVVEGASTPPPSSSATAPVSEEATVSQESTPDSAQAPDSTQAPGSHRTQPQPMSDTPPPVLCPSCSHPNSGNNRFCAACGFKLEPAPASAAAPSSAAPASTEEPGGIVLTVLNPDGAEAGSFTLPAGGAVVGRSTGNIFGNDDFLSPEHASFTVTDDKVVVEDKGSLNGVFRKLLADQANELADGQIFRIGQELVRYQALDSEDAGGQVEAIGGTMDGVIGRVSMILGRETTGTAYPVTEDGISLGRERGQVLFPEDGYVSGLHCKLSYEDGTLYLTDLGSSNGTFIQLLGPTELSNGDILLMGQQLYRVTI